MMIMVAIIIGIGIIQIVLNSKVKRDKASKKGEIGEKEIVKQLKMIPGTVILRNLYLPLNRQQDKFTEVDIIAVNKAGIYVIESKNYGGEITGTKEGQYWYQSLTGQSNSFYNPLKQNKTHCTALKYRLPKYENYIKSLIVFGDGANISGIYDRYGEEKIIKCFDIYDTIMEDIDRCRNNLKDSDIKAITQEIQQYTNVSRAVKKQHIRNIKRRYR